MSWHKPTELETPTASARYHLHRMAAALRFPADPALRRQLWRQWVHFDPPQGDQPVTPMRRVPTETKNRSPADVEATIEATNGVVDGLSKAISEAVVDGQLSLADRQRLIARAVRLGLSRFDASLLVASVQHREAETAGIRVIRQWKRPAARSTSVSKLVGLCLASEAALAVGIALWLTA